MGDGIYLHIGFSGRNKFFDKPAPHKKMKFSIKDFFSKCDQIRRKLRIWSYLHIY